VTCGVVVVELRGFEPLTACMPYTACRRKRCCSEPSPLVMARARLSAGHRCCPLVSPGSCLRHAPGAFALGSLIRLRQPPSRPRRLHAVRA
jgi:hypothetical protein